MVFSASDPDLAIGLMSGTSADGVDAALIRTNGVDKVEALGFVSKPYTPMLQQRILDAMGQHIPVDTQLEHDLTLAHIDAVQALLEDTGTKAADVSIIGFHGQTLFHAPHQGLTVQIGDGHLLARATGINVVAQFRVDDVAAGGQGAPLIPMYHHALAMQAGLELPMVFLNIGGVSNITYVSSPDPNDLWAFDCGPGNALLDDFMRQRTGRSYDDNGALANTGTPDQSFIDHVLTRAFFDAPPPKSLDRNAFHGLHLPHGISDADGAATLSALTAACVLRALDHLPHVARHVVVCGGGRHNGHMMHLLRSALACPVVKIEAMGCNGDATEAEGFAYLAVRSHLGLPLSFPKTTGVKAPQTGGRFFPV